MTNETLTVAELATIERVYGTRLRLTRKLRAELNRYYRAMDARTCAACGNPCAGAFCDQDCAALCGEAR